MKRSQRSYTPELKAEILALLKGGAPVKRIARERHIPESTVRWFRDHAEVVPVAIREKAEKDLASEVDRIRRLYLARASEDKAVATTSGYYAVLAATKLTEVHQLLRGEPTSIVDSPFGQLLGEIRDLRAKSAEASTAEERKALVARLPSPSEEIEIRQKFIDAGKVKDARSN